MLGVMCPRPSGDFCEVDDTLVLPCFFHVGPTLGPTQSGYHLHQSVLETHQIFTDTSHAYILWASLKAVEN